MPHITRLVQRQHAKEVRETGEQITLLITTQGGTSTATPFDIVGSNESVNVDTATKVQIYAHLRYHDLGDIKYQEGGKGIYRKADVEASSGYMTLLQQCFGVMTDDGTVLLKETENLSETKAIYILTCAGYGRVPQNI